MNLWLLPNHNNHVSQWPVYRFNHLQFHIIHWAWKATTACQLEKYGYYRWVMTTKAETRISFRKSVICINGSNRKRSRRRTAYPSLSLRPYGNKRSRENLSTLSGRQTEKWKVMRILPRPHLFHRRTWIHQFSHHYYVSLAPPVGWPLSDLQRHA